VDAVESTNMDVCAWQIRLPSCDAWPSASCIPPWRDEQDALRCCACRSAAPCISTCCVQQTALPRTASPASRWERRVRRLHRDRLQQLR
jgi:hypothetical protein